VEVGQEAEVFLAYPEHLAMAGDVLAHDLSEKRIAGFWPFVHRHQRSTGVSLLSR